MEKVKWAGELGMEDISYCGKCEYQQPNCGCPRRIDRNYGPKGGELVKEVLEENKELLQNLAKPNSGGVKFDQGKPDMSLISGIAMVKLAEVLTFGAQKYAAHNWRKGISWSRIIAGILRHLFAYLRGERIDPETGLSHAAHAMCGFMFLLDFEETRPEFDDLYKGN